MTGVSSGMQFVVENVIMECLNSCTVSLITRILVGLTSYGMEG